MFISKKLFISNTCFVKDRTSNLTVRTSCCCEKECAVFNCNNLTDISFSLPRGGSLGIIGATGSGKSTLIKLLLRFYDVSGGCIRIDGKDIRTIDKEPLYAKFGVAMQYDFLYGDTIEENIRF